MTYNVSDTPRRIARLPYNASILLRVLSGSVRIGDSAENLHSGGGIPLSASDGTLNWRLPEMEFWAIGDPAGQFELIIP